MVSARSRHGLHVVRDGDAPAAETITSIFQPPGGRPFVSLWQQSVLLAVTGTLNADTAGRLRMFLAMFTGDGGPRELLLDLSDVVAVDEHGMAPVFEAHEAMGLRAASLRLTSLSAAVAHYLHDARHDRTLAPGSRPDVTSPDPAGTPAVPTFDEGPPRGQD